MGQFDTSTGRGGAETSGSASAPINNGNGSGLNERAGADVRRFADDAKESAQRVLDEQRQTGASAVDGVARAVRTAADELDRTSPDLARYTREAASMAEGVSDAIRNRSLSDLIRSADDFARREPVAFFGAAALAGFVLTRFLSSSARHDHAAGYGSRRDIAGGMASAADTGRRGFEPRHASSFESRSSGHEGRSSAFAEGRSAGERQSPAGFENRHVGSGAATSPGSTGGAGSLPNTGTGQGSLATGAPTPPANPIVREGPETAATERERHLGAHAVSSGSPAGPASGSGSATGSKPGSTPTDRS